MTAKHLTILAVLLFTLLFTSCAGSVSMTAVHADATNGVFSGRYLFACDGTFAGQTYREVGDVNVTITDNLGGRSWDQHSHMIVDCGGGSNLSCPQGFGPEGNDIHSSANFIIDQNFRSTLNQPPFNADGAMFFSSDGSTAEVVSQQPDFVWVCHFHR